MASATIFSAEIIGLDELRRNLTALGDPRRISKVVGPALIEGAKILQSAGRSNAATYGLSKAGVVKTDYGRDYYRRGRIPRSFTAGKPYIPRNAKTDLRIKVFAAQGRKHGNASAPHAHLIEYGFTRYGRRYAGRSMLGLALTQTFDRVVQVVALGIRHNLQNFPFPHPTGGRKP